MESTSIQVAILAGGLATRLRPLTDKLPKALAPTCGRPFIDRQLALLRSQGVTDVVLCVGYLGKQIADHVGEGRAYGLRVGYSWEREDALLGTAGALKNAEPLLFDEFFVLYADSYLRLDLGAMARRLREAGSLACMAVFENRNRLGASNVILDDGKVAVYDKERQRPEMRHINYGISLLRREALQLVPTGKPYSQEDFFADLIARGELAAYEVYERFYEIGSPEGLDEFERAIRSGAVGA